MAETRRLELHEILKGILGTSAVYFQPPESVRMTYPAIVYGLDNISTRSANDGIYLSKRRYSVTIIDKNPDTNLVDKMLTLPLCQYNRHYEADNLNHDVFTLYF